MFAFKFKKPDLLGWILITLLLLLGVHLTAPENLTVLLYKFTMLTAAVVVFYWISGGLQKLLPNAGAAIEGWWRIVIIAVGVLATALAI